MDQPIPGAAAPVVPETPPVEIPAQAVPVPAAPIAAPPAFQQGGPAPAGNGGIKGWFKDVSLTDVIMGGLAVCALGVIIFYYRNRVKEDKKQYTDTQSQIDELKSNLQTVMGDQYQKF